MHEMLMAGSLEPAGLKQDAQELKLDEKQFESCLAASKYKATVENDRKDADRAGITATPTFFINGITIVGAETEENLSRVIDEELARQAAH
jgi:protein-disulfide isomerase